MDGFAIYGGHKNRRRIDEHQATGLVFEARDPGQGKVARADERGISKVSSSLSIRPSPGVNIRIRRISSAFACEKPVNTLDGMGPRAAPTPRISPTMNRVAPRLRRRSPLSSR
jgi:hypothetical protein